VADPPKWSTSSGVCRGKVETEVQFFIERGGKQSRIEPLLDQKMGEEVGRKRLLGEKMSDGMIGDW